MKKIFLESNRSKTSTDAESVLGVSLRGSEKLLPVDSLTSIINATELYNEERLHCQKIRLNCVINTICSNVLFNPFTEIVQNEGSESAVCLNFLTSLTENENVTVEPIYKEKEQFSEGEGGTCNSATLVYNLIDDTQLSSKEYGNLEYHCGLDFFNNHILRSKTFKCVNPIDPNENDKDKDPSFNTMSDYHRNYDGKVIKEDTVKIGIRDFSQNKPTPYIMHLYQYEDLLTFKDTFKQKLKERNGWFGFINKGKIKIYDKLNTEENNPLLDISKPINNREACEFIDMYPSRDLFNFAPKYNSFRHRIEKNWNYCLTYPSENIVSGIPFIEETSNSLRIILIDETYPNAMKIYSMSKHGLKQGDSINIYRNGAVIIHGANVTDVEDDYHFFVSKNGNTVGSLIKITDSGVHVKDDNGTTTYKFKRNLFNYHDKNSNFLDFSFKKVVNGQEVDYYIRKFSRLPNWKLCHRTVDEKIIYDIEPDIIEKYQFKNVKKLTEEAEYNDEQFENHIGKLAFSQSIYGDNIGEIVYNDDIVFDYLHDNLGRPLHEIFLTIIKTNKGRKEWYEEDENGQHNTTAETVEYSHCFDKVSCGFYLNPDMYDTNYYGDEILTVSDTKTLHTTKNDTKDKITYGGLDIRAINENHVGEDDDYDEVNYYKNSNYYGDLCSYSHTTCKEEVIQQCDFRFNTYIRERNDKLNIKLNFTNIKKDDYDVNEFSTDYPECKIQQLNSLYEGYYYHPHFTIPIRSISSEISQLEPKSNNIKYVTRISDTSFRICTFENNYLEKDDYFFLYQNSTTEDDIPENPVSAITYVNMKVTKLLSLKEFECELSTKEEDMTDDRRNILANLNMNNKVYYRVIKPHPDAPNYSEFLTDGSCKHIWREIIQNGFDEQNPNSIEQYQFTNNAFYVTKNFNLYLRRQNPRNTNILTNAKYDDFNIDGNFVLEENINNYYSENKIKC